MPAGALKAIQEETEEPKLVVRILFDYTCEMF